MKRTSQHGFGVVEIILIIVIVGIVGFVGWRVYEAQQDVNKTSQNTEQASNNQAVPRDKEEEHLTYTNKEFGYQFKYPKAWKASSAKSKLQESPESTYSYSDTIESPDIETSNEGIGFHLN